MLTNEITCVNKISSNHKYDLFEYRDMYNDIQTIEFPIGWEMTIEDVEKYLTYTEK
jgi:hypothetical protein